MTAHDTIAFILAVIRETRNITREELQKAEMDKETRCHEEGYEEALSNMIIWIEEWYLNRRFEDTSLNIDKSKN